MDSPSRRVYAAGNHALKTDGGVWIIDPVDAEGIDELVAEYGEVAGVVLLSNYHTRDADVFANRHGVSVYLPEGMEGIEEDLDALSNSRRRFPRSLMSHGAKQIRTLTASVRT